MIPEQKQGHPEGLEVVVVGGVSQHHSPHKAGAFFLLSTWLPLATLKAFGIGSLTP